MQYLSTVRTALLATSVILLCATATGATEVATKDHLVLAEIANRVDAEVERAVLEKALQKGGIKRSGDVWMRLAVAHYGLKDNPGAITALQKALTFDESSKQASEWLRALGGQASAKTADAAARPKS